MQSLKNTRLSPKTWLTFVKNEKVMFERVLFLFTSAIGSVSWWNCQSLSRQGHWPDPHITVWYELAWCCWSPASRCFPPIKNSYLIQWVFLFCFFYCAIKLSVIFTHVIGVINFLTTFDLLTPCQTWENLLLIVFWDKLSSCRKRCIASKCYWMIENVVSMGHTYTTPKTQCMTFMNLYSSLKRHNTKWNFKNDANTF